MRAFSYERAKSPAEAARAVAGTEGAKFLAGGTNLLDLMKLEVETPAHLVDVQDIGLDGSNPPTRAACASARWSPIPHWRRMSACAATTRC